MSDKDWAIGDYEVVLTLETDKAKPFKKKFSITKQEK
jgi:chlorite dismutase